MRVKLRGDGRIMSMSEYRQYKSLDASDDSAPRAPRFPVAAAKMTLESQMRRALALVPAPGAFACGGELAGVPALAPAIDVEGVGRLALPLCPQQAAALRAAAEVAPHGRGMETVVDEGVRRARQVPAARVRVGAAWEPVLARLTAEVLAALGVAPSARAGVVARLDKLVVYGEGGHFRPHCDTEKEPGMFATLVVQLPVAGGHAGGELRVEHAGERFELDTAALSDDRFAYAAFFADCQHELRPITGGGRLVLLYNLVRQSGGPPLAPADRGPAALSLAAAASMWPQGRLVLALPLAHKYTRGNASLASLKGRDAALAEVLRACPALDAAHLALVEKRVQGSCCDGGGYGGVGYGGGGGYGRAHKRCRYGDSEEDEDEDDGGGYADDGEVMDDEIETVWSLKWPEGDGGAAACLGAGASAECWLENALLAPLFGDDDAPDAKEYEGYTGNAGPTIDYVCVGMPPPPPPPAASARQRPKARFLAFLSSVLSSLAHNPSPSPNPSCHRRRRRYKRAVLVVWPRSHALRVAAAGGCRSLLALLERRLSEPWGAPAADALQALLNSVPAVPRRDAAELWPAMLDAASRVPDAAAARSAALALIAAAASWLASDAAGTALARTVQRLRYADVTAAALALARRCAPTCAKSCAAFVLGCAGEAAYADALRAALSTADDAAVFGGMSVPSVCLLARLAFGDAPAAAPPSAAAAHAAAREQLAHAAGREQLARAALQRAAQALAGDDGGLLKALVAEPSLRLAAGRGEPSACALARRRVAQLQSALACGPPPFSWAQPGAQLPGYPTVEAFLRGPDRQRVFSIFQNLKHARCWCSKYFGGYASNGTYSASASEGGRGAAAFATVTKTRAAHERALARFAADTAELSALRALLPPPWHSRST
jgi:hypothetical protein